MYFDCDHEEENAAVTKIEVSTFMDFAVILYSEWADDVFLFFFL